MRTKLVVIFFNATLAKLQIHTVRLINMNL